jgi:D-alanyl-D-alanine endopeptidase (penicillin-binding protein 7)
VPPSPLSYRACSLYLQTLLVSLLALLAISPAPARAAGDPSLKSLAVLVVDQDTGESLISKNADVVMPIASLTKLMTAVVVLDARLPMDEMLEITDDDVDREKHTHSRLAVGTRLSRSQMLLLALMSSENRAALSLSRAYPGGREAFISHMNAKAASLGMTSTHFADPAGLSSDSVSTARDLLRLVSAADTHAVIRSDTTQLEETVKLRGRPTTFINTNHMIRKKRDWDIELQKTGFTNEAGRCLVMRASTLNRKLSMAFLNSFGPLTRFADAARTREYLRRATNRQVAHATTHPAAASSIDAAADSALTLSR